MHGIESNVQRSMPLAGRIASPKKGSSLFPSSFLFSVELPKRAPGRVTSPKSERRVTLDHFCCASHTFLPFKAVGCGGATPTMT